MPPPLVWINGFSGSGKMTVTRELVKLLGEDNAMLIDNHQMIDPVEATTRRGHPLYQERQRLQREKVFQEYVLNPKTSSQIIIFTGEPLKMSLVPSPTF